MCYAVSSQKWQKAEVKKPSDQSDVDMFEPSLQFSSIMSTDEVIQITLL